MKNMAEQDEVLGGTQMSVILHTVSLAAHIRISQEKVWLWPTAQRRALSTVKMESRLNLIECPDKQNCSLHTALGTI